MFNLKNFVLKKVIQKKLKGVPESQVDMIISVVEKNPELFKKIDDEIKSKVKAGRSEMAASMEVMRVHQAEIQKAMKNN